MVFEIGKPKTGGRQAGTPNKYTRTVRILLEEAFEGLGGLPALIQWGRENPDEFYKLWGRMLPIGINTSADQQENSEVVADATRSFHALIEQLADIKSSGRKITWDSEDALSSGSSTATSQKTENH